MLTQKNFSKPLVMWYKQNKRDLPWRKTKDPYAILVSEIMLQQTRVEAVKKYYARFMEQFPTAHSLAQASQEELLRAWQGLGYYRRATNLQRACQQVVNDYEGKFPTTKQGLLNLTGIGDYTSSAVASICFNEQVPAVDGNVLRVMARVLALQSNVLADKTKKEIYALLLPLVPQEAGEFNQAFMDLGSVYCLPNTQPICKKCPLFSICQGKENATQYPVRITKKEKPTHEKTVFILQYNQAVCIEKRTSKGLLAGMYQFPNVEGFLNEAEAATYVETHFGNIHELLQQTHQTHIFTHQIWHMRVYVFTLSSIKNGNFVEDVQAYPIPTAFLKCLQGKIKRG